MRKVISGPWSSVTVRVPPLKFLQIVIQALEAALPVLAIGLHPRSNLLQRFGLEPAGSPLRLATLADQPRVLQHLEMLGDGGEAEGKRLRQLVDGCLALSEPRQDGPPGGIGEGSEGGAQVINSHFSLF
jgi:hypothetical protein